MVNAVLACLRCTDLLAVLQYLCRWDAFACQPLPSAVACPIQKQQLFTRDLWESL